jgi:hypothetical protein
MALIGELKYIQELHDKGRLTDQEYADAKAALLKPDAQNVGEEKRRSGSSPAVLVGAATLVLVAVLIFAFDRSTQNIQGDSNSPSASTETPAQSIYTDDADRLIARCGRPSLDDSTADDKPRPPIPSRWIEYDQQKLRFMFIPGAGAKLGDLPPYHWGLTGITDITARDPSQARAIMPHEALERMPCWR